jgi:hypothetical protein
MAVIRCWLSGVDDYYGLMLLTGTNLSALIFKTINKEMLFNNYMYWLDGNDDELMVARSWQLHMYVHTLDSWSLWADVYNELPFRRVSAPRADNLRQPRPHQVGTTRLLTAAYHCMIALNYHSITTSLSLAALQPPRLTTSQLSRLTISQLTTSKLTISKTDNSRPDNLTA